MLICNVFREPDCNTLIDFQFYDYFLPEKFVGNDHICPY